VPFDRRVWLECRALRDNGYDVAVVCPEGPGDPKFEIVDGVALYKYRPIAGGNGVAGFLAEYAYSFAITSWLVFRAARAHRRSAPILAVTTVVVTAALAVLLLATTEYGAQIFPPVWGVLALLPAAAGIVTSALLLRRR